MHRHNHYEAAFEAYLRQQHLGYIAVDESRRSLLDDQPVKSLDFIVYGAPEVRLLVDVKGRRFPAQVRGKPRRVWQNWSTREDISGLTRWLDRVGPGYRGLLVFLYQILPEVQLPADTPDLFEFRERQYLLRAVDVFEYERHMRIRSPRWDTVCLPQRSFRALVQPLSEFLLPRFAAASDWDEPFGQCFQDDMELEVG
jgi:hypothetical protein